jgi:hypothetical protein
MTDEPVGDLTPTGAWIHAHVRFIDQIAGTLLVMSLPAGLAVRITTYQGVQQGSDPGFRTGSKPGGQFSWCGTLRSCTPRLHSCGFP